MQKVDIHKAAGVLLQDRKFLVCRSRGKNIFYAPGGKLEQGESAHDSLVRELKEELGINIDLKQCSEFGIFYAPASGAPELMLRMDVFMVNVWNGTPAPRAEVEEIRWIDSETGKIIEIASIFGKEVLPRLKNADLID